MSNPFELIDELDDSFSHNIEVWLEVNGRKKNTYVSGWKIDLNDLKEHLKTLKKKLACNGSIKIEDNKVIIQLQGDHCKEVGKFIEDSGINQECIRIRGLSTGIQKN